MDAVNLDNLDLHELVQVAFDKYMIDRIPELLQKQMPLVDQTIADRIKYASETNINKAIFDRVKDITETTVGNYLRVGGGRSIIDTAIFKYLDKKLEEHIEAEVKFRVKRVMERLQKDFNSVTEGKAVS